MILKQGLKTTEFIITGVIQIIGISLVIAGYQWQIFLSSCIVSACYVASRGFVKMSKAVQEMKGVDVTIKKS